MSEINTVCILTNYRTGSTSFNLLKSQEHNVPYKGSLFALSRPWGYGDVLAEWEENEMKDADPSITFNRSSLTFKQIFMNNVAAGMPACFKLTPDQVYQHWVEDDPEHDLQIAESCDKVYILYRRDFRAQALSYIGMRCNGEYNHNGISHQYKSGNPRKVDFYWKTHVGTSYNDDKVVREIKLNNQEFADGLIRQLTNNYNRLSELYTRLPNAELVCMEDFFGQTDYLPYNHEFVWLNGEPQIPEFDVEGLFSA